MHKISSARKYLKETSYLVFLIFGRKCIICGKPTNVIHEIIPISHGKKFWAVKNRVPICNAHHDWAHNSTKVSIPILREKRKEFLSRLWKIRQSEFHGTD